LKQIEEYMEYMSDVCETLSGGITN